MSRGPGVVVLGAGGHAKVVISTLQAAGYTVDSVFDDNPIRWGTTLLGIPVRGGVAELAGTGSSLAVIAIGDNATRQRIVTLLPGIEWTGVVHPAAYVHPSARLGAGSVVFAGVVIQPDVVIGRHTIVNTGATVDHDSQVGAFAHLAPGVHLAGNVHVGEGAFLGIGSLATPGRTIGDWSTVGAGGVVIRDLPPGVTAVGVPAVPLLNGRR